MTYFDQIKNSIYDGAQDIEPRFIDEDLRKIGLSFPLHLMIVRALREDCEIAQNARQKKYFWTLHEELICVLWNGEKYFWAQEKLCGEPQYCADSGTFVRCLQDAIISFRKTELATAIQHGGLSLSLSAEFDARRLALSRIRGMQAQHWAANHSAWQDALIIWLETVLLRHQKHLNTLRRKLSEFVSLMTCDLNDAHEISNIHQRIQRELQNMYSLQNIREKFIVLITELLQEIPFSSTAIIENLSPIAARALVWIDKNYGKNATVADCARSIPVSSSYLCRLLRKETGISPIQHLQKRRIAQAKVLLREGTFNIDGVAYRSGFGSVEHFHRVFRKYVGMTPSAYRRGIS